MRIGTLSIKKEGQVWQARVETPDGGVTSGFGATSKIAMENLGGALGDDRDRLVAYEAFMEGVNMDTRDTPSEAFVAWWSKR